MSLLTFPCLSVCPHLTAKELVMDFHEIWYWAVILKFVDTFQLWSKFSNNNKHFPQRPTCIFVCGSDWVGNPPKPAAQPHRGFLRGIFCDDIITVPDTRTTHPACTNSSSFFASEHMSACILWHSLATNTLYHHDWHLIFRNIQDYVKRWCNR
jgi:hypothetical protein